MLWVRAPLQPACLCPWARSQFASLTRAYLVPVDCGEYYNLSADRACTWPVANHCRWSKMIVTISWRGNNIGNSACILRQRRYTNADIIITSMHHTWHETVCWARGTISCPKCIIKMTWRADSPFKFLGQSFSFWGQKCKNFQK